MVEGAGSTEAVLFSSVAEQVTTENQFSTAAAQAGAAQAGAAQSALSGSFAKSQLCPFFFLAVTLPDLVTTETFDAGPQSFFSGVTSAVLFH